MREERTERETEERKRGIVICLLLSVKRPLPLEGRRRRRKKRKTSKEGRRVRRIHPGEGADTV